MAADPYAWPGTDCLRNRAGLHDPAALAVLEARVVAIRDTELRVTPLPGVYDLAHLRRFHHALFSDIYDWAGELRTVNIDKGVLFCTWDNVEPYASEVLQGLRDEHLLIGLNRDPFLDRLTHYLAEVNAVHPFREGNGRTQRAFFRQLAAAAGWHIDWAGLDRETNIEASRRSLRGHNDHLRAALDAIVCKRTE
jgi:cell filamentation protein